MPPQKENGHRTASEMEVQIFLVLLMSVALGKAAVYGWANRHVGVMTLGDGKRMSKVWGELVL